MGPIEDPEISRLPALVGSDGQMDAIQVRLNSYLNSYLISMGLFKTPLNSY